MPDEIMKAPTPNRRKAYNSLKVEPIKDGGFKRHSRGSLPSPSSRGSDGDFT